MLWIKYKLKVSGNNVDNDILIDKSMTYSKDNLDIVEKEAFGGKYKIIEGNE